MLHDPSLHRLRTWLRRFRHPAAPVDPAPRSAPPPVGDSVVPTARPAVTLAPGAAPVRDALGVPECPAAPPLAPLAPQHEQGLCMAGAHRWNWAQRELEAAVRASPCGPAAADLASVREVRRQLRVLRKWPRDIPAHLTLGRSYFELGLGADAEETFCRVLTLAPDEPSAPYFLALEHAFRGEWAAAEGYYARASTLAPDLPPFAVFQGLAR